jgi:hypothetical protein
MARSSQKAAEEILKLRKAGKTDAEIACDGKLAAGFRFLQENPDFKPETSSEAPVRARGSGPAAPDSFRPGFSRA